jgi:photosystem II stability/assembly factor-like uncharacterized protein
VKRRYFQYSLAVILVTIMVTVAAPYVAAQDESPAILKWDQVDKPGIKWNVIVTPSEVSKIAVGLGDIIYAIDSENGIIYRSDNGGLSWEDITPGLLDAGAVLPAYEIAVAPKRPRLVAVVTDNRTKVFISDGSGVNWNDTSVPTLSGTEIQCITISSSYSAGSALRNDVAIGTADWDSGDASSTTEGQLWTLQVGGTTSAWKDQNITVDPGFTGAEVSAIAFSPNYDSDGTILVAASTAADVGAAYSKKTWLCIGKRDLSLQTTSWNSPTTYPVDVTSTSSSGDATDVTGIMCSIAFPSDYVGVDASTRITFMSYNRQPNVNNDAYRINDITATISRMNVDGGNDIDITNISYYGTLTDGKLLAGDVDPAPASTVQVRRSINPLDLSPSWYEATQPPSGPGNAQVSWSSQGTAAYCGTGQSPSVALDESAFSRSFDNGDTWEQVSLIDTVIRISDIAPAPDSKSLFIATYSAFGTEGIWRSAGEPLGNFWGRILTLNTTSDRLILRLSPDYDTDYTLCVVEVGGQFMEISQTRGNTWHSRYIPGPVIDVVMEDEDTLYVALQAGSIRKSTTGGSVWGDPVSTGLDDINMLFIAKNGHIFVGSRDSRVAYSTDSGATFTVIPRPVDINPGDVQVATDAHYTENGIIYAATDRADDGIWRWVIGSSTEWEQIDEPVTRLGAGQRISGLLTGAEGTLYALRSEPVAGSAGGMTRSLNPFAEYTVEIEFDIVNATLPGGTTFNPIPLFLNTLPALKMSSTAVQNELWAFDIANEIIFRFQDNICKIGPATTPVGQVGCDPASSRNQEFGLRWEQLSLSDGYEIQVAKDDIFSLNATPDELESDPFYTPPEITDPAYFIDPAYIYECGHVYYWRVRTRHAATGEVIRSPWSDIDRFIIKAGLPVTLPYYGIQLLSPDNGCTGCTNGPVAFSWSPYKETEKYRFVLAKDADMTQVIVRTEVSTPSYEYKGVLNYNTSYFWRVMALEPAPSEWSATFSFQTISAPLSESPPEESQSAPPFVWAIIGIGTSFVIFIFILLVKTR